MMPLDASAKRKVCVLYTGGTMGMQRVGARGSLMPVKGYLTQQIRENIIELKTENMPSVDVVEFETLLDSSDIGPLQWVEIATAIRDRYYDYDGIVVIQGTDTMCYTASALSFMLHNLGKPVILTGSQVPFERTYNDARRNLVVSVMLAGTCDIPEVCIFFNDTLLRGNRSIKIDNTALTAFTSPNFEPLAQLSTSIIVNRGRILPQARGRFRAHLNLVTKVAVLRLVPGFDDECVERITTAGSVRAIVLLLYGTGNAPARKSAFLTAIRNAVERGVVVVAATQCVRGGVELDAYTVGSALKDVGVLGAGDMTTEATVAKLAFLLSLDLGKEEFRSAFERSLRGERSLPARQSSGDTLESKARRELNIKYVDGAKL